MFIETTKYETEQIRAMIEAGEFHGIGPAVHRINVITSDASVMATGVHRTNEDDDDGDPDGEWIEWEHTYGTADRALADAGKCRVGISGVIVTVTHNGEEVR